MHMDKIDKEVQKELAKIKNVGDLLRLYRKAKKKIEGR